MKTFGISDYNEAESGALSKLSNAVLEAFFPETSGITIAPSRTTDSTTLVKFLEGRTETHIEDFYSNVLQNLTPEEFDLLQNVTGVVCDFSEQWSGKLFVPRVAILEAVNVWRQIKYLFGDAHPRIFEVSPGPGYLGILAARNGCPYAAFESRQAYYVLQHQLWRFFQDRSGRLSKEDHVAMRESFFEGAISSVKTSTLDQLQGGEIAHLPWWDFIRSNPEEASSFDVVVFNHAAWEMTPQAIRFSLNMASKMLYEEFGTRKLLICPPWTTTTPPFQKDYAMMADKAGLKLVQSDPQGVFFVPGNLREAEVFFDPARDFRTTPIQFFPTKGTLSQDLMAKRRGGEEHRYIPFEQLHTLYQLLTGLEDPATEDERFKRMVGE